MISLFYTLAVLTILACFVLFPKKPFRKPPFNGGDDDGGEPIDNGLPDLDLPPGITLPINDWEPEYNRRKPRRPVFPERKS
jgi:hypothetical protein